MKILIPILFCLFIQVQKPHTYIRITSVTTSIHDTDRPSIVFANQPDSTKYYSSLKLKDCLQAIELMEKKGFELVTINSSSGPYGVIITTAFMRRK